MEANTGSTPETDRAALERHIAYQRSLGHTVVKSVDDEGWPLFKESNRTVPGTNPPVHVLDVHPLQPDGTLAMLRQNHPPRQQ